MATEAIHSLASTTELQSNSAEPDTPKCHTAGWPAAQKEATFGKLEFLELPAEIRLLVYEQLFGNRAGKTVQVLDHVGDTATTRRVYCVWMSRKSHKPEITLMTTCQQVYDEVKDVLYHRNYFCLFASNVSSPWFDGEASQLQATLLPRIENLALELRIYHDSSIRDWLRTRLMTNSHGSPQRAKSEQNFDGDSELLFWLLEAIPRTVTINWVSLTRPSFWDTRYLSVRTLKRLAKEHDKVRGTAPTLDADRREPDANVQVPAMLKELRDDADKARKLANNKTRRAERKAARQQNA
ncbi:hypothetical protein NA57DRAFT_79851 [Rhizodiscina lignyota]|uniref:DUF7730 domain-containing protein n=1 Tax=Rhizodiscina lignyota TaxID=1504668 RepID=A0A9P4M1J1_9PEZI|nr:hypothetical protein NA57DRAFT_79851 [Rhizodiscina lignyota]